MKVGEVRNLTKGTWSWDAKLPPQRVTVRCACGWCRENVLVPDGSRYYAAHRRRCRK